MASLAKAKRPLLGVSGQRFPTSRIRRSRLGKRRSNTSTKTYLAPSSAELGDPATYLASYSRAAAAR